MADESRKAMPAGVLVFYDEGRGLRQPSVKMFNPSPGVEQEINEWIRSQRGVVVHRIDWLPSGGLMGAAVHYSQGNRATESLRVPIPTVEGADAGGLGDTGLQRLGVLLMVVGVFLGVVALAMFTIFFPETWYGGPDAVMDPDLAVQSTVLAAGIGTLLTTMGVAVVFRGRLTTET